MTTSHGGKSTLTEQTVVTSHGSEVTYITGTNSSGRETTYVSIPDVATTIPATNTYTYRTKSGTVTVVYEPTSSGQETITYNTIQTSSGYETIVDTTTSNGATQSYTDVTSTARSSHGGVISYEEDTSSSGGVSTITKSTERLSNGSTVTHETDTTTNGGVSYLTSEVETTSQGAVITYVTGTTVNGGTTTYVEAPTAVSYETATGGHITRSYIPTSTGVETVQYSTHPTRSGSVVTESTITSGGGRSTETETIHSTIVDGYTQSTIEETTAHGSVETIQETTGVNSYGQPTV